jgi:branched-subunit amino acid transport protein
MRMTRGFGSITFLIIFITGMISVSLSKFAGWPVWVEELLWGLPAAVLNAVFAPKYAEVEKPKFVIDRTTMEEVQVTFPRKHTLFWIPVRFWTYIILGYTCAGMIQEFHLPS